MDTSGGEVQEVSGEYITLNIVGEVVILHWFAGTHNFNGSLEMTDDEFEYHWMPLPEVAK